MKLSKKFITFITTAAMTAAVTSAPISALAVSTDTAPTGALRVFHYTINALGKITKAIKQNGGEDYIVTLNDANAELEDGETGIYVTVFSDEITDGDVTYKTDDVLNLSYETEDAEGMASMSYNIKTEDGKVFISSDDGKTWTEAAAQ